MKPYLGVLDFALSALNKVASAPIIYIVLAGDFASLIRLPALASILAPINGPTILVKFGASLSMRS